MRTIQVRNTLGTIAAMAVVASGSPAFGAGFQINEHSAAATGRASAVTATVKDPSAIWHNPAGLTNVEGTEAVIGASVIIPRGNIVTPGTPSTNSAYPNPRLGDEGESASSTPVTVPYAYVGRALSTKAYVGFGFYMPYGLGIKWQDPDQFSGRTSIQELSLRTFFLTPAIALKLSDMVSVAVGVSLVPATLYLKRSLGAADNGQVLFPTSIYGSEGTTELSGTAFGVGATAGVQLTLIDHLKIGLSFRSAVDLSFSGDARFTLPEGIPAEIAANFPDQEGGGDVTLPHTFGLGIGWDQGNFVIEAATQLTMWNSYDELRINFSDPLGRPSRSSASPRDWEIVPLFRAGAQYNIDDLSLRLGIVYDISPVPDDTVDPTLPDNDRIIGSFGVGYSFGMVRVDVALMAVGVLERTVEGGVTRNFPIGEPGDTKYSGGVVIVAPISVGIKI